MEKTSSGLDENIAGAAAYALGWITGIVFLMTEPANRFVRFHALQSIIVFGGLSLAWFIALVLIPPLSAVLWLLLMFKAYQRQRFKLPFAGDIAEQRER